MNILLKLEEDKDYNSVEYLTREAFWDVYRPGCYEHLLVHNIRSTSAFVKELNYIAIDNEKIVGNIIYSKARIVSENGAVFEVLCIGPLGVLPDYQKRGIGTLLMEKTLDIARNLGYKAVIIFGSPKYYQRFGFKNAKYYSITTSDGKNFDAFMALELKKGVLSEVSGKFYEDKVFELDNNELEEFEKNFPYKEKHITDTQLK